MIVAPAQYLDAVLVTRDVAVFYAATVRALKALDPCAQGLGWRRSTNDAEAWDAAAVAVS